MRDEQVEPMPIAEQENYPSKHAVCVLLKSCERWLILEVGGVGGLGVGGRVKLEG